LNSVIGKPIDPKDEKSFLDGAPAVPFKTVRKLTAEEKKIKERRISFNSCCIGEGKEERS